MDFKTIEYINGDSVKRYATLPTEHSALKAQGFVEVTEAKESNKDSKKDVEK